MTKFCPGWLMNPRACVWLHVLRWAEGGGAKPSHVLPSCIPTTPRKWSPDTHRTQPLFVDHKTTELELADGSTDLCKVMLHRKVSGSYFTAFDKLSNVN